MTTSKLITQKCIDDIKDRVQGVFNDLKAFIYIRNKGLEHKDDNIGGGNMVTALCLFTTLNFLAKTYYCTVRQDKFNPDGSVDETEAFIHFMRFIQKSNLDLGIPPNGDILMLVWSGFRNWLAHRLVVQPGKQVITFTFEIDAKNTVSETLAYARTFKPFQDDGNGRNWIVNCDVLLAYIPDIVKITTDHIANMRDINNNLLLKVIDTEYP